VEKDIDYFVILAVDIVVMDEFQELPHLVFCDGFPRHAVIDHHPGKLKAERVLHQHVIVNRHLEGRAQDAPHRLDGAVMPPILLELYQEQLCVRCLDLRNLSIVKSLASEEVLYKLVVRECVRLGCRFRCKVTFHQLPNRDVLP